MPKWKDTFSNAERKAMSNSISDPNYPSEIKGKSRHAQMKKNEQNVSPIDLS